MSTDGMTIKERIALLKQSSPAQTNEPSPAINRPKSMGYALSKAIPIDGESSLDERPKSLSVSKSDSVTERLESLKINMSTPTSSSESADSQKEKKSSSIADRIAALKNKSSENDIPSIQSPAVPKKLAISFSPEASSETHNETENSNIPSPPVKKLNTDRVNFAKALNVVGFNPFAPRPPTTPAKELVEDNSASSKIIHCHSDSENNNGEMKHLSLSRPSAPTRKKIKSITKSTAEWLVEEVANNTFKEEINDEIDYATKNTDIEVPDVTKSN